VKIKKKQKIDERNGFITKQKYSLLLAKDIPNGDEKDDIEANSTISVLTGEYWFMMPMISVHEEIL